jgi:hypothetical protein
MIRNVFKCKKNSIFEAAAAATEQNIVIVLHGINVMSIEGEILPTKILLLNIIFIHKSAHKTKYLFFHTFFFIITNLFRDAKNVRKNHIRVHSMLNICIYIRQHWENEIAHDVGKEMVIICVINYMLSMTLEMVPVAKKEMKKEMGIVYEFLKLYSCQTREK